MSEGQFKVKSNITGNVSADDTADVLKKQGGCGCQSCAGQTGGNAKAGERAAG